MNAQESAKQLCESKRMLIVLLSDFHASFCYFLWYLTGFVINFRLLWPHYRCDEKPSLLLVCVGILCDKDSFKRDPVNLHAFEAVYLRRIAQKLIIAAYGRDWKPLAHVIFTDIKCPAD